MPYKKVIRRLFLLTLTTLAVLPTFLLSTQFITALLVLLLWAGSWTLYAFFGVKVLLQIRREFKNISRL
jgi:uncharacterized membrane protein